jgi:hypothetical protein
MKPEHEKYQPVRHDSQNQYPLGISGISIIDCSQKQSGNTQWLLVLTVMSDRLIFFMLWLHFGLVQARKMASFAANLLQ